MARHRDTGRRGAGTAFVLGGGLATAAVLVSWLRTRAGQRRYQEFLVRMEQTAALAQQRAREAQQVIQHTTDDFAAAVKGAAEDARRTIQKRTASSA